MDKFVDRYAAGKTVASQLLEYKNMPDTIALALPRGGVPVGYEIAKALAIPLDVFIVRKLGVPGHEELAMGALATGGTVFLNNSIVEHLDISHETIERVIQKEQIELARREALYRGNRPFPILQDKTIILIDDGIATGATTRAAIKALRNFHPARIILAIPVAALSTYKELSSEVDRIVCPLKPTHFDAVGMWYENFSQTEDNEVSELLQQANHGVH